MNNLPTHCSPHPTPSSQHSQLVPVTSRCIISVEGPRASRTHSSGTSPYSVVWHTHSREPNSSVWHTHSSLTHRSRKPTTPQHGYSKSPERPITVNSTVNPQKTVHFWVLTAGPRRGRTPRRELVCIPTASPENTACAGVYSRSTGRSYTHENFAWIWGPLALRAIARSLSLSMRSGSFIKYACSFAASPLNPSRPAMSHRVIRCFMIDA